VCFIDLLSLSIDDDVGVTIVSNYSSVLPCSVLASSLRQFITCTTSGSDICYCEALRVRLMTVWQFDGRRRHGKTAFLDFDEYDLSFPAWLGLWTVQLNHFLHSCIALICIQNHSVPSMSEALYERSRVERSMKQYWFADWRPSAR
jgi:hypothetical protein